MQKQDFVELDKGGRLFDKWFGECKTKYIADY